MAINRDKVYDGAMKLLAQGKFDKGIVELQKLVAEDPKDVRTLLKIAETLHVKMGRKKEALEAYDRAANVYAEQGFFLKAVAVFKQMLSVDATNPDLHLRLAELYQQMGYGAQCLHHYQQVVVFYEQQGRGKDMVAVLKRMVDLDPENLQSRVKVAELFHLQGMVREAVTEMRQAFEFLRAQDRTDDAIRVGEKICAWDPTAVDIARQLGALYMQRGEAKSALAKLQLCYAQAPRDIEILGLIASAFLAINQVGKTVSVYKEMARIHEGDGNVADARRCWELVLQYAPGDAEAEGALGIRSAPAPAPVAAPLPAQNPEDEALKRLLTETDVYVKYGLRDKAIEHLDKIFKVRPDYLPGLEKLRQLQKQTRQPAAALETLRRMVARARETGHPRLADWSAELAQLEAATPAPKPAPKPAPRRDLSTEGEVILVEEEPAPAKPAAAIRGAAPIIRGAPPPTRVLDLDKPLDEPLDEPLPGPRAAPAHRAPPLVPDEPLDERIEAPGDASATGFPDDDAQDADAIARAAGAVAPLPLPSDEGLPADELVLEQEAASGDGVDDDTALIVPPAVSPTAHGEDDVGMLDALAAQAVSEAMPAPARAPAPLELSDEELGELEDVARAATGSAPPMADDDFSERTVAYGSADWQAQLRAAQPTADDSLMPTGERYAVPAASAPVDDATGLIVPPVATMGEAEPMAAAPAGIAFGDDPVSPRAPAPIEQETFDPNAFDLPDDVKVMLAAPPPGISDGLGLPDGFDDDADAAFDAVATGTFDPKDIPSLASAEADVIEELEAELRGTETPPPFGAPPAAVDDVPDGPSMSRALFAPERGFEDDPANTFFPDELAEAEFFIQQDLLDEAREILEPILEEIEDSARVKHMLARVAAKEAGEPEPPPPWQQKIFEAVAAEAAPSPELSDPGQISVEEVLSQFKKGIAETVPEDDAATHFDLGIAYREMGLLDDAVGEFEVSARAASKAPDAWFLIGLVRLDQGRSDDALIAFERALMAPGASRAQKAAAEYQRGVVFADHRGNGIEGLMALKRSKQLGGTAPDLDRRIQDLVKVHGDVDVAHASGAGHDRRPKNIDYV